MFFSQLVRLTFWLFEVSIGIIVAFIFLAGVWLFLNDLLLIGLLLSGGSGWFAVSAYKNWHD